MKATRITIQGQRVTFQRQPIGWIAIGWEGNVQVATTPVSRQKLQAILNTFPPHMVTVS